MGQRARRRAQQAQHVQAQIAHQVSQGLMASGFAADVDFLDARVCAKARSVRVWREPEPEPYP